MREEKLSEVMKVERVLMDEKINMKKPWESLNIKKWNFNVT